MTWPPHNADLIAYTQDSIPQGASIAEQLRLAPVLKDGAFYPFTYKVDGEEVMPLSDETPTGAFSYDGKVYVFVATGYCGDGCPYQAVSRLTF